MKNWIEFRELYDTGKTKVWGVSSTEDGAALGEIKWHVPWRTYSFFPMPNTIFEVVCLSKIMNFIYAEMNKRKKTKQN